MTSFNFQCSKVYVYIIYENSTTLDWNNIILQCSHSSSTMVWDWIFEEGLNFVND